MDAPAHVVVASTGSLTVLVDNCITLPGVKLDRNAGLGAVLSCSAGAGIGIYRSYTSREIIAGWLQSLGDAIAAGPTTKLTLFAPKNNRVLAVREADVEAVGRAAIVSCAITNAHVCFKEKSFERQCSQGVVGVGEIVQREQDTQGLTVNCRGDFKKTIAGGSGEPIVCVPGVACVGAEQDEAIFGRIAIRAVEVESVFSRLSGADPSSSQAAESARGEFV